MLNFNKWRMREDKVPVAKIHSKYLITHRQLVAAVLLAGYGSEFPEMDVEVAENIGLLTANVVEQHMRNALWERGIDALDMEAWDNSTDVQRAAAEVKARELWPDAFVGVDSVS
jgi:hypothetical protein